MEEAADEMAARLTRFEGSFRGFEKARNKAKDLLAKAKED